MHALATEIVLVDLGSCHDRGLLNPVHSHPTVDHPGTNAAAHSPPCREIVIFSRLHPDPQILSGSDPWCPEGGPWRSGPPTEKEGVAGVAAVVAAQVERTAQAGTFRACPSEMDVASHRRRA